MELKTYQKTVIKNLDLYMQKLDETKDIFEAWKAYWKDQDANTPDYKNEVDGVPKVCMKVPTGGGKTFIACASLKYIFDKMPYLQNKVVVWLVPSDTILNQTINNLSNANHPYRERLNKDFNNRVEVYTKEMLLQGQNFSPDSIHNTLSVCIMSFDSFRSNKKEGRNVYKENGNLKQFADKYSSDTETNLEEIPNTALIQILRHLNPVIIVDESHNATSDLSLEMLANINPTFILELTATPKDNSNVISYVDARELKRENMVKLPVIVYNRNTYKDVIRDALSMRRKLEEEAKNQEEQGGEYIRPIILFQAQPKNNSEDNETFEKIKKLLLDMDIPEEEIAIKTAKINELKEDLLSKNCKIRYIITVNALKEGWDCPFAYILASLANRSSDTEVEQILGRILRQPYVKKHKSQLLNLSYVFTSSEKFHKTIENIVEGLKLSGFSDKEYRIADDSLANTNSNHTAVEIQQHITKISNKGIEDFINEFDNMTSAEIKEIAAKTNNYDKNINQMIKQAENQNTDYNNQEILSKNSLYEFGGISDMQKQNVIQEEFREEIKNLKIPQFFKKGQKDLFGEGCSLLERENLSEGFRLNDYDANIHFNLSTGNIYSVDIDNNKSYSTPKYVAISNEQMDFLKKTIQSKPKKEKIEYCAKILANAINKNDQYETSDVRKYVNRVIENLSDDEISTIELSLFEYANIIKDKIIELENNYRLKKFKEWLDIDKIICKDSYTMNKVITPINTIDSIPKSLYTAEDANMNGLERSILDAIVALNNIKWWHRIIEKKDFYINGFINHYPDFMVMTKNNRLILIEVKGDDRDNSNSRLKLELGRLWQAHAGNKYRYYMVFDNQNFSENGAFIKNDFIELIKNL